MPEPLRPATGAWMADSLVAGAVAGAFSGLPSTLWALVRGHDPLAAVRAAGTLVLADDPSPAALVGAGTLAHGVLSLGWATVLALALPERQTAAAGALAGLGIAALDLGIVGRRFPAIRTLPTPAQVADHLAFGLLVAAAVRHRRRAAGVGARRWGKPVR